MEEHELSSLDAISLESGNTGTLDGVGTWSYAATITYCRLVLLLVLPLFFFFVCVCVTLAAQKRLETLFLPTPSVPKKGKP